MTDQTSEAFHEGETIYDVDGNPYVVNDGRAVLLANAHTHYNIRCPDMKRCFSRTNPRQAA